MVRARTLGEWCRVGVLKRSAPADDELGVLHRADASEAVVLLDDRQPRSGGGHALLCGSLVVQALAGARAENQRSFSTFFSRFLFSSTEVVSNFCNLTLHIITAPASSSARRVRSTATCARPAHGSAGASRTRSRRAGAARAGCSPSSPRRGLVGIVNWHERSVVAHAAWGVIALRWRSRPLAASVRVDLTQSSYSTYGHTAVSCGARWRAPHAATGAGREVTTAILRSVVKTKRLARA